MLALRLVSVQIACSVATAVATETREDDSMSNDQNASPVERLHYQSVLTTVAQKEAFRRLAGWLTIPFHSCSGKMLSLIHI